MDDITKQVTTVFIRGLQYNDKYVFADEEIYEEIREGIWSLNCEDPEKKGDGEGEIRNIVEVLDDQATEWIRKTLCMPIKYSTEVTARRNSILAMVNIETARYGSWQPSVENQDDSEEDEL